jgi:hypothetical protein
MSIKRKFTIFHNTQHSWLSVKLEDLIVLDLISKITVHSYMDSKRAYLEIDEDAAHFLNCAKQQGWAIEIKNTYSDKISFKSFPSFTKNNLEKINHIIPNNCIYLYNNFLQKYSICAMIVSINKEKVTLLDKNSNLYQTNIKKLINSCKLYAD